MTHHLKDIKKDELFEQSFDNEEERKLSFNKKGKEAPYSVFNMQMGKGEASI